MIANVKEIKKKKRISPVSYGCLTVDREENKSFKSTPTIYSVQLR